MLVVGANLSQRALEVIKQKTSDQSVQSSTTLVDETDMQLAMGKSETWLLEWVLRLVYGTTGQFSCKVVGPTNYTFSGTAAEIANGGSAYASITEGSTISLICTGLTNGVATVRGIFTTDANNAGTAKLQFTQDTSSGTSTTIKGSASYLRARKVA